VAKHIRNLSFIVLGVLTVLMVSATIIEKIYDTQTALHLFYHSPVVIALWAVATVLAMGYVITRRKRMSVATFGLHSAFVVILIGAAVSHQFGEDGTVKLIEGAAPVTKFGDNDLGFGVKMTTSEISYYDATATPKDYATNIEIIDKGRHISARVSMNNVYNYNGYRFYQTALGGNYSVLSVSHDPWGIGITYAGYALLFLSILAFPFSKKSRFRATAIAVFCLVAVSANAQQVLQRPLAENYGKMLVYWNGRVAPVQTMAREFCTKVYGSDTYKGYTAEQVLTGWIFYYDDWKAEPFIKIKDAALRDELGIDGKYAALSDFYGNGAYKLQKLLTGESIDKAALQADEKINLIAQVCTGQAMKIYPITDDANTIQWVSWIDRVNTPVFDDALFVQTSMEDVARNIAHGKYNAANDVITKICEFQRRESVGKSMPSEFKVSAERLYNMLSHTLIAAIAALLLGIAAYVGLRRRYVSIVAVLLWCYLTGMIVLRWVVSGHLPMTNGFETMQATAWIALTVTLCARRIAIITPMGLIVCGLALMVSVMGESNPTVSQLMPVLASPLLSIHVMLIMTSYALFAIMMLNGVAALLNSAQSQKLANISIKLHYPATLLLAAGIFVGAIWANQSWGRYWGWDPKETWALVTLIVYALPMHAASFPAFNKARTIHLYNIFAFLTVLFTYFGVNFLLSGMHSYAAG
jgi:ABC-type transport system involved in cytochrome c biogenesis permease subunit